MQFAPGSTPECSKRPRGEPFKMIFVNSFPHNRSETINKKQKVFAWYYTLRTDTTMLSEYWKNVRNLTSYSAVKSALNGSWTAPGSMPGTWKGSPGAYLEVYKVWARGLLLRSGSCTCSFWKMPNCRESVIVVAAIVVVVGSR